MVQYDAGFIGAGNMGGALLRAARKQTDKLAVCDPDAAKAEATGAAVLSAQVLAHESAFVFLGVKPYLIDEVCASIRDFLPAGAVVVSMAAGVTLARLRAALGTDRVIRIMPNTPAAVGAGLILYAPDAGVNASAEAAFRRLLAGAGALEKLDEKLIDAGMAVSGCGPAYVYMFCEAMADGAVRCGLPRDAAQRFAAQTLLGAAQMLLQSGAHPGALKDAVCSPGGTTIEGVLALEDAGFRAAVSDAVIRAYEKAKN